MIVGDIAISATVYPNILFLLHESVCTRKWNNKHNWRLGWKIIEMLYTKGSSLFLKFYFIFPVQINGSVLIVLWSITIPMNIFE